MLMIQFFLLGLLLTWKKIKKLFDNFSLSPSSVLRKQHLGALVIQMYLNGKEVHFLHIRQLR